MDSSLQGHKFHGHYNCTPSSGKIDIAGTHMRGTTALSPARNILKQMYHIRGACVSNSVPKKQNNDLGDREGPSMMNKSEPELIVAFNKPPLPPVLGPFIILSLLEMGSSGNDD